VIYSIIIYIFFKSIISLNATIETTKFSPNKNLPLEVELIVHSLNDQTLTTTQAKQYKEAILKLEILLNKSTKKDIHFFSKSYFYRFILNRKDSSKLNKSLINLNNSRIIQDKRDSPQLNPFSKWIIDSLLNDLYQLGNLSSPNSLSESKKQILIPWYNYFLNNTIQDINQSSVSYNIELLSSFEKFLSLYVSFSRSSNKETSPIKYFTLIPTKKEIEKNTVAKILESTEIKETILPEKNQWMPKGDDTKKQEKMSSNIILPDPNYIAPKKLPVPTNDW